MTQMIVLRVIQGSDRGRVFRDLPMPITIGREEGNVVQLNDERVSRYHVKIQEDEDRLVITDLDSTNGTRINGQTCNLKILRPGDTIAVGRSILLVGTEQSSCKNSEQPNLPSYENHRDDDSEDSVERNRVDSSEFARRTFRESAAQSVAPDVPHGMTTGQAAELREILDHVHQRLQKIVQSGLLDEKLDRIEIARDEWKELLEVQSELSVWIRAIEDPQTNQSELG